MKRNSKSIEPFNKKRGCWNVIIETPKGSNVKYALDEDTGFLTVKKALPDGMVFPFNFGMIPGTQAEDGDPVAVPKEAPTELEEMELSKKLISQIEFFFKAYNQAFGETFKVLGTGNAKKAIQFVKSASK